MEVIDLKRELVQAMIKRLVELEEYHKEDTLEMEENKHIDPFCVLGPGLDIISKVVKLLDVKEKE